MGLTPKLSLPYPELGDSADVPRDIKALADKLDPLALVNPPLVTALPGAPVDGQECYLQTAAMAAAGVIWHLRYRAAIADAYKWECLGGAPLIGAADTGRGVTSTAYVALPTDPLTITMPTKGVYDITQEATVWSNAASGFLQALLSYTVGATAPSDAWAITFGLNIGQASCASTRRQTFPGPTLTCSERGRVTGAMTGTFAVRRLIACPVRVAA